MDTLINALVIFLLFLSVVVIIRLVVNTASKYFSPVLREISTVTSIPEHFAGVTVLAFGNGAPDVFTVIAARSGNMLTGMNALLGGVVFVSTIVLGAIIISSKEDLHLNLRNTVRDAVFLLTAAACIVITVYLNLNSLALAVLFFGIYMTYISVIAGSIQTELEEDHPSGKLAEITVSEEDTPVIDYYINLVFYPVEYIVETVQTASIPVYHIDPALHRQQWEKYSFFYPLTVPLLVLSWVGSDNIGVFQIIICLWLSIVLITARWFLPMPVLTTIHETNSSVEDEEQTSTLSGARAAGTRYGAIDVEIDVDVVHFTPQERTSLYFWLAISFLSCILWIDLIAAQLIACLSMLGEIINIPKSFLGLTVLAWGNSVGDLSTNTTLAAQGKGIMALSACYGGPLFNILFGVGAALLLNAVTSTETFTFNEYSAYGTTSLMISWSRLMKAAKDNFSLIFKMVNLLDPVTAAMVVLIITSVIIAAVVLSSKSKKDTENTASLAGARTVETEAPAASKTQSAAKETTKTGSHMNTAESEEAVRGNRGGSDFVDRVPVESLEGVQVDNVEIAPATVEEPVAQESEEEMEQTVDEDEASSELAYTHVATTEENGSEAHFADIDAHTESVVDNEAEAEASQKGTNQAENESEEQEQNAEPVEQEDQNEEQIENEGVDPVADGDEQEEEVAQYDETEYNPEDPQDYYDEGDDRASLDYASGLTLDTSQSAHSSSATTPLSKSSRTMPTDASGGLSPMKNSSAYKFGSHYQHKKVGASWVKNNNSEASAAAASPVTVSPMRHSQPRKVIPVSDQDKPLSTKQSTKISQYEEGLQAEKDKVSSKVLETRRRTIEDVITRVLLDGEVQLPSELDPTSLIVDPAEVIVDVKTKKIVKEMKAKFDTTDGTSGGASSNGRSASVDNN